MRRTLLLMLTAVATATSLKPYGNARFDYWVHIPADLTPLPPPDNGDGQAWQSRDGQVTVSVWGSHGPGVLDIVTVNEFAARTEKWARENGSRVTYRKLLRDSFVLSGYLKDGRIFYQKTLLRSGTEASVRIEYPTSRRAIWDKRVGEIAATLKWGGR